MPIKKLALYFSLILVILIFLSKISLKLIGIPYTLSYFIFQHGLHPYVNIVLQVGISFALLLILKKTFHAYQLRIHPGMLVFFFAIITTLIFQTFLQIIFVNVQYSIFFQLNGLIMAVILIVTYGVIIPTLLPVEKFVKVVGGITVVSVVISLILFIFFPLSMIRGGRFIGIYKHIPHFVSVSTLAAIFYLPKIFESFRWTLKDNTLIRIVVYCSTVLAVVFTFTKAAIFSVVFAFFVGVFIFGKKTQNLILFKVTMLLAVVVTLLLTGVPISQFVYNVSTGKVAIGSRPAQDGVQTRTEEVYRGLKFFQESPYFGRGLMYKYMTANQSSADVDDVDFKGYNSFKDPHNLFISAGVIGGYPLLILSVIGFFLMIFGAIKGLRSHDENVRVLGLFLLVHIPVFIIYHAHFSLGGIGDRIYWMVFGYLSLTPVNSTNGVLIKPINA